MMRPRPSRALQIALGSSALLVVLALVIWIPDLRGEDETPGPDPGALALALGPESMPSGFTLEWTGAAPIQMHLDDPPTETASSLEYRGLSQDWVRPESSTQSFASISIWYYLLVSNEDAGRALQAILRNRNMAYPRRLEANPPEVGDASFGVYPTNTVFIRGRAIIEIITELPQGMPRSVARRETATLVDPIVAAAVQRLDDLGIEPRPLLAVDLQVLSRHVNVAQKEIVRLRLSSSETHTEYTLSCYRVDDRDLPGRLGDLVYEAHHETDDGTLYFEWSGKDEKGVAVPNGRYRLHIQARDPLRRMKAFHVDVQVNNQGGK